MSRAVPGVARAPPHADIYYVNVAGLGGEPDYEQHFVAQAADLDRIARRAAGGTTAACGHAVRPESYARASAAGLVDVAGQTHADDMLIVNALVGHGSFDSTQYKFNLPGPDVSAEQLAAWCDHVAATRPS